MTSELLFERHYADTLLIAESYVHKFKLVGSLSYRDDIISEGLKGLWQASQRFDPKKQLLNAKNTAWNVIFSCEAPLETNPYDTFWDYAKLRIHGSIRDYLRKERLTVRQYGDGAEKSLILEDRFVSLDKIIPQGDSYPSYRNRDSYGDYFRSSDTADKHLQEEIATERVVALLETAHLSDTEFSVVKMMYAPPGMDVEDVALSMKQSQPWVRKTVKLALLKIVQANLVNHAVPA